MTFDRVLGIIGSEFKKGIILYFETHKELLTDPDYNCAYKVFRNSYARENFGNVPVNMIGTVYAKQIDNLLNTMTAKEVDTFEQEVHHIAEIMRKNNFKESYNELFDDYFGE